MWHVMGKNEIAKYEWGKGREREVCWRDWRHWSKIDDLKSANPVIQYISFECYIPSYMSNIIIGKKKKKFCLSIFIPEEIFFFELIIFTFFDVKYTKEFYYVKHTHTHTNKQTTMMMTWYQHWNVVRKKKNQTNDMIQMQIKFFFILPVSFSFLHHHRQ